MDGGRVVNLKRIDDDAVRLLAQDQSELASDLRLTLRRPGAVPAWRISRSGCVAAGRTGSGNYAVSEQAARKRDDPLDATRVLAASQVVAGVDTGCALKPRPREHETSLPPWYFARSNQRLSLSEWIEGYEPILHRDACGFFSGGARNDDELRLPCWR